MAVCRETKNIAIYVVNPNLIVTFAPNYYIFVVL